LVQEIKPLLVGTFSKENNYILLPSMMDGSKTSRSSKTKML
jgi:hypothetical protein